MRFSTRFVCTAALICCGGGDAWAQSGMPDLPTILHASTEHALALSSHFMSDGATQCDADGNLYVRPVFGSFENSGAVVRIDIMKSLTTGYPLPKDLGGGRTFFGFSVTRSGKVWVLVQPDADDTIAATWDASGNPDAQVNLKAPANMLPQTFSVADDGIILVGGVYTESAAKELQGQGFLAVFDQTGNLRRSIEGKDLDSHDVSNGYYGTWDSGATAATDGNFYVIQHGRILVVSEWGTIVKQLKIDALPDATAHDIRYGDGLLSIEMDRVDKDHAVHFELVVLNAGTGDVYSWYRMADETKGLPACFFGRAGYSLLNGIGGQVKIVKVPLR
jgi:hypothetical protein